MANVIEITDFSAPELDIYARLTEAQLLNRFDPGKAMFIAESSKVIHRALDAGYQPVSLLMERKHVAGQAADVIARCGDAPVYVSDLSVLTQLTSQSFLSLRDGVTSLQLQQVGQSLRSHSSQVQRT